MQWNAGPQSLYIIASSPKECMCASESALPFHIFASMGQILSRSPLAGVGSKMPFGGVPAVLIPDVALGSLCLTERVS